MCNFYSDYHDFIGVVAQLVERLLCMQEVQISIICSSIFAALLLQCMQLLSSRRCIAVHMHVNIGTILRIYKES